MQNMLWDMLFGSWDVPISPEEPTTSSPESDSERAPRAELPSLPPELWVAIIQEACPAPSYDSFELRSSILRSFSLVNRTWRSIAQQELFSHPVLPSGGSHADQLIRSLKNDKALGNLVRTIRLGGRDKLVGGRDLSALLEACGSVKDLWIAGWANCDLAWLSKGKSLRRLYLTEARIVSTLRTPFILPSLEHLYLKGVIVVGGSYATLFSPTGLPSLRSLDCISIHLSPAPAPQTSFIASLAPQLTSVAIGDYHGRTFALSDLSTATRLTTIDIPYTSLFPNPDSSVTPFESARRRARTSLDSSASASNAADDSTLIPPSLRCLRIRGVVPAPHEALITPTIRAVVALLAGIDLRLVSLLDSVDMTSNEMQEALKPLGKTVEIAPRERWGRIRETSDRSEGGFRGDFDAFREAAVAAMAAVP